MLLWKAIISKMSVQGQKEKKIAFYSGQASLNIFIPPSHFTLWLNFLQQDRRLPVLRCKNLFLQYIYIYVYCFIFHVYLYVSILFDFFIRDLDVS